MTTFAYIGTIDVLQLLLLSSQFAKTFQHDNCLFRQHRWDTRLVVKYTYRDRWKYTFMYMYVHCAYEPYPTPCKTS